MRIGVDLDGVIADFNSSYIQKIIELTGEDKFPPRPFDIPVWNYPEYYNYSDEQVAEVWEVIKRSESFWQLLLPYNWTAKVLQRLHRARVTGHDIYFITSRPGVRAKQQTELWLQRLGYVDATVLISDKKGYAAIALDLETYIDDKPSNVLDVVKVINNEQFFQGREQVQTVYMLNQPWNRGHEVLDQARCRVRRVETPLEMLDRILPNTK